MKNRSLFLVSIALALLLCTSATGQITCRYYTVRMDSTWDRSNDPLVESIIGFYKPKVDVLMQEVIGISEVEMRSERPESLLSNFTADAMLEEAKKISLREVDFSLTNFGGLRAVLPEGEVRRFDIFSIYPFENYMVIVDLSGASVKRMFESFAEQRVEAFSHSVQMEIESGKLKNLLINGKQVEDGRIYRVATIDFLLTGGDNITALKEATDVEQTGLLLRDVMINYIESVTKEGKQITSHIDNRVKEN